MTKWSFDYRLQDICFVWPFCSYFVKPYPWFYIAVMDPVSEFWTTYFNVICMNNKILMVWTECYMESWEIVLLPWCQMDLLIRILRIKVYKLLWYLCIRNDFWQKHNFLCVRVIQEGYTNLKNVWPFLKTCAIYLK